MKKIEGYFEVNGVGFADWFNRAFRIGNRRTFPHRLDKNSFIKVMNHIQALTGKEEISLGEFVGHFCIIYNETGGRFEPMRERGGLEYLFEARKGKKVSYNKRFIQNWDTKNRLAGDYMKQKLDADLEGDTFRAFNFEEFPKDIFEANKEELTRLLSECDFHKYRGGGLKQLTWRANYLVFVQPLLDKDLDDISDAELTKLLDDMEFNCKIFNKYINSSLYSRRAISKLAYADFADYGYAIAGRNAHRYVNYFYMPRCKTLYNALLNSDLEQTDSSFYIDNANFTPSEIQNIQEALLKFAPAEESEFLEANGGMDKIWGYATQRVFEITGLSINHLLTLGIRENLFTFDELSRDEIEKVQRYIFDNGSEQSRFLIENNGGFDGIAGRATRKAFKLSKRMIG